MNLDPEKILVIGVLALLVLGPSRLPDAARAAGKLMADLRRMKGSLQNELTGAIAEPKSALNHAVEEFGIKDLRASVRDTISTVSGNTPSSTPPSAPSVAAAATAPAIAPVAATPALPVGGSGVPPVPDDPSFN